MRSKSWLAIGLLLLAGFCSTSTADTVGDCRVDVYRLPRGEIVDIAPTDGASLRWRKFDGSTGLLTAGAGDEWKSTLGWTSRPDGIRVKFAPCERGTLEFDGARAKRIPLESTDTKFAVRDTTLAGRLVMPAGRGRVPIVVLVHGAERDSARDFYFLQRLLPAVGIGAFVYDKRGTGASGGVYTQDFGLLADDAIAALHEARRLAGTRAGRVGYQGGSAAGWVLPIAVNRERVDFVIVSFGLAVTVIDEDFEAIELEMRLKGHDMTTVAKAFEVARAGHALFESGFTKGYAEFEAMRAKYRGEPWYPDLHGNFTHFLLGLTEAQLPEAAAKFVWGTPFRYDPMPALRAVEVPQLWVLGADDLDAPSAETSRRLTTLIDAGRNITLAMYPGAEHGMTEYEIGPAGERLSTRYSAEYFALMRDFARDGRLRNGYGRALLTRPGFNPP